MGKCLSTFVIIILIIFSASPSTAAVANTFPDSVLIPILNEINSDSLGYNIQKLESFGTRYMYELNRTDIVKWLVNRFRTIGAKDISVDTFLCKTGVPFAYSATDSVTIQYNVTATITGTKYPDEVILIGGHYDSFPGGKTLGPAPGADDNGSGTSAVIEIARAVIKNGYKPDYTLKFVCFGAEELMLSGYSGSEYYAETAKKSGMKIPLMINLDMIATNTRQLSDCEVQIMTPPGSLQLRNFAAETTKKYSQIKKFAFSDVVPGFADGGAFWAQGFQCVYFMEDEFSPYYHSANDLLKYCDMNYCREVSKAAAAILLTYREIRSVISDFTITDYGDGSSLFLEWKNKSNPYYSTYKILKGTSRGVYTDTIATNNLNIKINGLKTGNEYFFGIYAVNNEDEYSLIVENSGTPNLLPVAPFNVTDIPSADSITISWGKNSELDFAGYNIFRSEDTSAIGSKLNTQLLIDSLFTDKGLKKGVYYYYTVVANDKSGKVSKGNTKIRSRCISLDQGILLVNGAIDGDGTITNPAASEIGKFYNLILSGNQSCYYSIISEDTIKLADMGAYNIVLWNSENKNPYGLSNYKVEIIKYLKAGGKLIFTGILPSYSINQNGATIKDYKSGDFIYDYFKIKHTENLPMSRFIGAVPANSFYTGLAIDSVKTLPSMQYHIGGVESLTPTEEASAILVYNSNFSSSQAQGKMKGMPVGVEYLGTDFRTIIISFPLYYMRTEDAKNLINTCISRLSGTTSVKNNNSMIIPGHLVLYQNYPNPFNPVTNIEYDIPERSYVEIRISDVLGREIYKLVKEEKQPGRHNVSFNGSALSSGIYFYTLTVGARNTSKKMLLVK